MFDRCLKRSVLRWQANIFSNGCGADYQRRISISSFAASNGDIPDWHSGTSASKGIIANPCKSFAMSQHVRSHSLKDFEDRDCGHAYFLTGLVEIIQTVFSFSLRFKYPARIEVSINIVECPMAKLLFTASIRCNSSSLKVGPSFKKRKKSSFFSHPTCTPESRGSTITSTLYFKRNREFQAQVPCFLPC